MTAPTRQEYRHFIFDSRRWDRFQHRPGDIFVCTPAKCGTTWMQTIVATLLFHDTEIPGRVMDVSPWIDLRLNDLDELLARLAAQPHRRSIKTHTPADGIPWYTTGSYIVVGRDGRDAFMSWVNHVRNMRPDAVAPLIASAIAEGIEAPPRPALDDVHAIFAAWLDDGTLFHHIATFWARRAEPNVLFVHYNEMKADLEGAMRRVAAFLGIDDVPDARWPELVERCSFASMKARGDDEIGTFERMFVGGAQTFFHQGTNGRWHDVLTADELAAYDRRAAELLPPDALAWLGGASIARAG